MTVRHKVTECVKERERQRKRSKEYGGAKMDKECEKGILMILLSVMASLILLDTPNSDTRREKELSREHNGGQ